MRRRDLLRLPLSAAAGGVAPLLELEALQRSYPPASPPPAQGPAQPRVTVFAFGAHEITEFQAEELPALGRVRGSAAVVWVNVDGITHAETVKQVGRAFALHPLALEDVMNSTQRPKLEVYPRELFLSLKMASRAPELELEQVSLFLGPDYVVTFQQHPGDVFEHVRTRLRSGDPRIRAARSDYLAYALIDSIVDGFFPVLEAVADELEVLEDDIVDRPARSCVHRLHAAKRELMALRRIIWPMREALNSFVRDPGELVQPDTVMYLRDCQDHLYQVMDLVEGFRELGASLTDLYLSTVGNRTNDIMKVLTVFAALFIPLSFITGLYGMNLQHPDNAWYWTWPFAAAVMVGIAVLLLLFFLRRGWIGSRK
jgi:magnesium transporter